MSDQEIIVGEPISKEMREALRAEFPSEAYSKHPTKTFLTTLKAAYVMERLNDVFGVGRWDLEHKVVKDEGSYVLMSGRIKILDHDVVVPVQYGGHTTTGKNTELADGYKSAITDILSKSASYLEIGLDMFKGKINPPSSGGSNYQNKNKEEQKTQQNISAQQAAPCPEEYLKPEYIDKQWNGKLYANNVIYFNNTKFYVNQEWADWLKKHKNYKEK